MKESEVAATATIGEKSFLQYASLDQPGFFQALQAAGFPDLSKLHLAGFIYKGLSMSNTSSVVGITMTQFEEVMEIATDAKDMFQCHLPEGPGGMLSLTGFQKLAVHFLEASNNLFPKIRDSILSSSSKDSEEEQQQPRSLLVRSMLDQEAFGRYSSNETGLMDLSHFLAYTFAMHILCEVFTDVVGEIPKSNDNDDFALTRETYPVALKRIGVACLERTFQGQFMDAVFTRTDKSHTGNISFPEFCKAGMTLIYPAGHHSYIKTIRGYPGWSELALNINPDTIAELISSLNTGDVILMQDNKGPMGQFINFSLNTPWCHASVVVKRSPLTGTPNAKTEEYLQKYPFRRGAHHFCSPGYCRCFDSSEGDFSSSKLSGLGHIGLLESTGEGIHLYDLAHRLFESGTKQWTSIAIARLHNAPGRDDTSKINAFIEGVRGGIYSVAKDELKAAIAFHHNDPSQETALPSGARGTDDFCASLVQRFYHHMGWVDETRPFNSVMPSDYDIQTTEQLLAGSSPGTLTTFPVELLDEQGWLSPLELVTCPDLNAKLPLKLPRKKA